MRWKAIGDKAIGTSHLQTSKDCEDSICFEIISLEQQEVLICCVSDGAGSASHAALASAFVTSNTVKYIIEQLNQSGSIDESIILSIAESLYDELKELAKNLQIKLNDLSCTFLGCVLSETDSLFFQLGDGLIIRDDNSGNYVSIWLPQKGEYANTTYFLVDDPNLSNLKIVKISEPVHEVALTTDGLQTLILNNETSTIHQPFFESLFKWLRIADDPDKLKILNGKLSSYLSSTAINERTDDDKTLFLATRLK